MLLLAAARVARPPRPLGARLRVHPSRLARISASVAAWVAWTPVAAAAQVSSTTMGSSESSAALFLGVLAGVGCTLVLGRLAPRTCASGAEPHVLRALPARADRFAAQEERSELEGFKSVALHDLRAPLRAIAHLVEWVHEDDGPRLSEASREHLRKAQAQVVRLRGLIDGALDYVCVGDGCGGEEWVACDLLVRLATHDLAEPENCHLRFVGEPVEVLVACKDLQHLFHVLLENATIHHDRPPARVDVEIRSTPDGIDVTVRDDGPGMDPSFCEKAFEPFRTLRSRDAGGGSGMGLAIARRMVSKRGGSIELGSDGVRGTVVTFHWPCLSRLARAEEVADVGSVATAS